MDLTKTDFEIATKAVAEGFSYSSAARALGISYSELKKLLLANNDFSMALEHAREEAIDELEGHYYKVAMGAEDFKSTNGKAAEFLLKGRLSQVYHQPPTSSTQINIGSDKDIELLDTDQLIALVKGCDGD